MKECKKARTVKFSTKWQVGRLWLKYDEEKVMFWEWCIKNKQTLVAQNVLNLTRFLYGCTSHKTELISYLEKSAAHLLAKKQHGGNIIEDTTATSGPAEPVLPELEENEDEVLFREKTGDDEDKGVISDVRATLLKKLEKEVL